MEDLHYPEDLLYSHDHEWLKSDILEAKIGITAFAARELGDIVFVEAREKGTRLKKGDIFGSIEAVKTVSDLFMPVSGIILQVNPMLAAEPELVNTDPYGAGWLVRMVTENPAEAKELMSAEQYRQLT